MSNTGKARLRPGLGRTHDDHTRFPQGRDHSYSLLAPGPPPLLLSGRALFHVLFSITRARRWPLQATQNGPSRGCILTGPSSEKCVGSASHSPSAEQFNTSATSPKRENHYLFPTLSEDHRRSLARPLERQRAVVVKHLHVLDGLLCFPIGAASDLAANC
jgi:hypothetical protein